MRKLYPWLGLLALAGCKQAPDLPAVLSPYKIDIQQGNVVTQEMLAKLKAGMTRAQVRYALGSPLVVDAFHTDRWDYVYSMQKQGKDIERRRVTVIFDGDKLLRLEGDILPVDSSLISDRPLQARPPAVTAPAAVATDKPAAAPAPTGTATADTAPSEAAKADSKSVPAEAKKSETAKADAGKEKPKPKGFFGRMMDKIGF